MGKHDSAAFQIQSNTGICRVERRAVREATR
jgi:hypothetical protein